MSLAQCLDHDTLLEIFSWLVPWEVHGGNIERTGSSPSTLRRASHVCQTWRSTLINSPSLWAQCIDLNEFRYASDDWCNIVLERSGAWPLTVTGWAVTPAREHNCVIYLLDVLDKHWARVRNLDVTLRFHWADSSPGYLARLWNILGRPTDSLRLFSLDINLTKDEYLPPLTFKLFSGRATSLQMFSIDAQEHTFPIDMTAPPSSIRILSLSLMNCVMSDVDLLTACMEMPRLETLTLHVLRLGRSATNLRPSIPRLKSICINCDALDIYPAFLGRIVPYSGCELRLFNSLDGWRGLSEETRVHQVEEVCNVIRQYATSLFTSQGERLEYVKVRASVTHFSFTSSNPRVFEMSLSSDNLQERIPLNILAMLFDCFSAVPYPPLVTRLDLSFSGEAKHLSTGFLNFLNSMSSIKKLVTNYRFLNCLSGIANSHRFFPFLETVAIRDTFRHNSLNYTLPFFEQRRASRPVRNLDLTESDCTLEEIRVLNGLIGLVVTWQHSSYTFGKPITYVCGRR